MKPAISDLLQHAAVTTNAPPLFRLIDSQYAKTPLGMGWRNSRFSSPNKQFRVLYSAPELHTCVMETILRDDMENNYPRTITLQKLLDYAVVTIQTTSATRLLPLSKSLCFKYSQNSDIIGGKRQAPARRLSQQLYADVDLDGMTYQSRFSDTAMCQVNYDRSVIAKLQSVSVTRLVDMPGLVDIFRDLNIAVIRSPTRNLPAPITKALGQ